MPPDPMAEIGQSFDPFAASANIPGLPRDPRPVIPDPRPHLHDPRTGEMIPYDEFDPAGSMSRGRVLAFPGDEDFKAPKYNRHVPVRPPLPSGTSPLGAYPAEIPAERMLEHLLQKPEDQINLGLGFDYPEQFKKFDLTAQEAAEMFRDERNVTLPGLLETHRGSCLTMPLLYVVIGQRLGLPVHLVTVGKHTFVRWDDGQTRVNIEATITTEVTMAEDDSVYMRLEELTPEEIAGTDTLRNLTNREVIGVLLNARSGIYYSHGSEYNREALRDASRALKLAPDSRFAKLHLEEVKKRVARRHASEVVIGPQLPPVPERK